MLLYDHVISYICVHTYMHFDTDSHAMPYVSLLESHLFDPVWAILVLGTVFCGILENFP